MARSLSDRKAQEWRQRFMRFEKSRQSITAFCRQEGVSAPSFYLWRKRLASGGNRAAAARPPAVPAGPASAGGGRERATARRHATGRAHVRPRRPAVGNRRGGPRRCRRLAEEPAHAELRPQLRIFLHARPTDMRKSFDGLCGLVRSVLLADPLDGSLFLFVNRRGDRLKALWWDRTAWRCSTSGWSRARSRCSAPTTTRPPWNSTPPNWPCS